VHSAGRRRVRRSHGGCARSLCRRARSEAAGCLLRREPDPTHRRGPTADLAAPGRLERYDREYKRKGTGNQFISLDVHRSWRKVKVTDSRAVVDFAACMRELTDVHFPRRNVSGSCSISYRPFGWGALPGLPRRKGTAGLAAAGVPLRPQPRQLAEHGRDRDRRAARSMPGPAHRHPAAARSRDRTLGTTAQCLRSSHQMDVHNRKSPRQNGPRLPGTRCRPPASVQRVIMTVQRY
jgi:hypothetical protein